MVLGTGFLGMRIAFECFGEFRCAIEHGHIETYMKTFPQIFDPSYGNTVDVFMLTSYHGDHDKKLRITDYVRGVFGERLKVLAFLEDIFDSGDESGHENIGESVCKQNEDQIMERWIFSVSRAFHLSKLWKDGMP